MNNIDFEKDKSDLNLGKFHIPRVFSLLYRIS